MRFPRTRPALRAAEAGRVTLDSGKAESCLTALAALSCEELRNTPASADALCRSALVARVPAGGACAMDHYGVECIDGYCEATACNVPGTCRAYAKAGEPCNEAKGEAPCGPGLLCHTKTDGMECIPLPAPSGEGGECDHDDDQCQPGLYCTGGGKCARLLTLDQPCWRDDECATGLTCQHDKAAGATPTCAPYVRVNGACTAGKDQCIRGAYCAEDGKCREWSAAGGACGPTPQGEERGCIDSWCKRDGQSGTGTCTALGAIGEACTAQSGEQVCGAFATCTGGKCVPGSCDD